ncbi:MAG: hypothetical protein SNJ64_05700 [Endomicrobiia bacterium]
MLKDDIIYCSDCYQPLVQYIVVDAPVKKFVRVFCPCGGKSTLIEIDGDARFDGYSQKIDDLDIYKTRIIDIEFESKDFLYLNIYVERC